MYTLKQIVDSLNSITDTVGDVPVVTMICGSDKIEIQTQTHIPWVDYTTECVKNGYIYNRATVNNCVLTYLTESGVTV
jgi:hypothetical protein